MNFAYNVFYSVVPSGRGQKKLNIFHHCEMQPVNLFKPNSLAFFRILEHPPETLGYKTLILFQLFRPTNIHKPTSTDQLLNAKKTYYIYWIQSCLFFFKQVQSCNIILFLKMLGKKWIHILVNNKLLVSDISLFDSCCCICILIIFLNFINFVFNVFISVCYICV